MIDLKWLVMKSHFSTLVDCVLEPKKPINISKVFTIYMALLGAGDGYKELCNMNYAICMLFIKLFMKFMKLIIILERKKIFSGEKFTILT